MHSKITPEHLDRGAVVYVRQSTMGQVAENTESQRRQYALAELARTTLARPEDIAPNSRRRALTARPDTARSSAPDRVHSAAAAGARSSASSWPSISTIPMAIMPSAANSSSPPA